MDVLQIPVASNERLARVHWPNASNLCVTVWIEKNGAPGAIPTRDLSLRRRALYATELREHINR